MRLMVVAGLIVLSGVVVAVLSWPEPGAFDNAGASRPEFEGEHRRGRGRWGEDFKRFAGGDADSNAGKVEYAMFQRAGTLENAAINESSGLAASNTTPGCFWTHNDSGGRPRLFIIDEQGYDLGSYVIDGARNRDWEAMCSFVIDGQAWLLVGDIGDNDRSRDDCTLYLVREPKIDRNLKPRDEKLPFVREIPYRYDDGKHDAEGLAFDATMRKIYIVSKDVDARGSMRHWRVGPPSVYELDLPAASPAEPLTAKRIATLPNLPATGATMSPDGRRLVIVTYLPTAHQYVRQEGQSWGDALKGLGDVVLIPSIPLRRQGEAIAFGPDGKTLYLTSEHANEPFWRIPVKDTGEPE